jgi:dihydrofolate reductase
LQKLRVANFSISVDGFGAGPSQDINNPLGVGGMNLHQWFFQTNVFKKMHNGEEGETGKDNDYAARGFKNTGAWIIGRNMFGPIRGNWPDDNWKGWWGENPPYHCPVFVLTNHPRESISMEGGTIFHFITDGIEAALEQAKQSANGKDVLLGGGVNTIRQYLTAKLIDEMHIAISPIILGSGERLFYNINLIALGYKCIESTLTEKALHIILAKDQTE